MFQSTRANSQIFILTKGLNPILEVGNVVQISQPRMAQMQMPNQYPLPMVVDMTVQVGNEKRNLNGLPADKDIFDYKGDMVITTEKGLIVNEINILKQQNEAIVNGYQRSKELIGIYDNMLAGLNPEIAEKKRTEEKIQSLEKGLAQQIELIQMLTKQNEALIAKLDADKTSKSSKNKEKCEE